MDASGTRTRSPRAVFVNELMFLVGVARIGASDCAFNYYSRSPDVSQSDSLFKADGSGYVDIRKRMADVEKDGRFTVEEVARSEALYKAMRCVVPTPPAGKKSPWWATDHDVIKLADAIKEEWCASDRAVNQSGPRHGQFSRAAIAEAIAKKIEDAEKDTGTKRSIGAKTISNYLSDNGWH